MADILNDRKKGYEAKFKLDQETEFKIDARRNKLLGVWLAERMGITASEVDEYAKEVVVADLKEPGIEDVVSKVMKDITDRDSNVTEDQVREKIVEFQAVATQQITENAS
jgi:hypothetical protein